MSYLNNTIGIRAIGTYIPEGRLTAEEIAEKSGLPPLVIKEKMGIESIAIPARKDHPVAMGVKAAQIALEKTNLHPSEIDLIIYVGEEYKEYPVWTAAIELQRQLQASKAWGFDISMRCGTSVMAMKVAKGLMETDERINTVLLAGGYRNGDLIDFQNPRTRFMYNLACGGGACILQKDLAENVVMETEVITDGRFSRDVLVTKGGSLHPLDSPEEAMKLDVTDPDGMKKRLEEVSLKNFLQVIRQSLTRSGQKQEDLDYLGILHMKPSAHNYVLGQLGLTEEQSIYLKDIGHVGQFDQWISLERAVDQRKVTDGSLIALVSAGIAYAWAATTIRWGRWS
ncbi:3-oxoacyl-[acyl-carrier-protein] synthase-3 [Evansella vedderi]|uniref:3-oxoacyl-[acyl-carrier-protein] synthase-3 n=1 Tax=Evansella vedderi TaxID=38282 RepID=A0ABU0A088_9BACI|nr:3-oxoacyl-ACP synthase [Evansella vedderi]MDQ0256906.1 3-oxoacyl-[acyl-carrier-protein] synthase-3 [Evansella vedderi]